MNGCKDDHLHIHSWNICMRGLLRGCAAPDLYWAEIPVHDPKTCTDGHMKQFENLQRERYTHTQFFILSLQNFN